MGAQRHNENRRIAGSDRWMGQGGLGGLSQSVTSRPTFDLYLLQIKTTGTVPTKHLDL